MVKNNKKNIEKNIEKDELNDTNDIIKESEIIINELVKELKECMDQKKNKQIFYKKPSVYTGTGSVKSTCTACRQRLWC